MAIEVFLKGTVSQSFETGETVKWVVVEADLIALQISDAEDRRLGEFLASEVQGWRFAEGYNVSMLDDATPSSRDQAR
jgi:hypothetical protein